MCALAFYIKNIAVLTFNEVDTRDVISWTNLVDVEMEAGSQGLLYTV
jgi:hypothetical protein